MDDLWMHVRTDWLFMDIEKAVNDAAFYPPQH
jgi:hypothetical protein